MQYVSCVSAYHTIPARHQKGYRKLYNRQFAQPFSHCSNVCRPPPLRARHRAPLRMHMRRMLPVCNSLAVCMRTPHKHTVTRSVGHIARADSAESPLSLYLASLDCVHIPGPSCSRTLSARCCFPNPQRKKVMMIR